MIILDSTSKYYLYECGIAKEKFFLLKQYIKYYMCECGTVSERHIYKTVHRSNVYTGNAKKKYFY